MKLVPQRQPPPWQTGSWRHPVASLDEIGIAVWNLISAWWLSNRRRWSSTARALMLTVGVGALASPCSGQTQVFVDATAPGGGDGTSWTQAYNDLQDALESATQLTEIWIAQGTYYPDRGTADPDATFILPGGVVLLGGFAGDETHRDDRDPTLYESILSGDIGQRGFHDDNAEHIMSVRASSRFSMLEGLTFTAGAARRFGGALHIEDGDIAVVNCRFVDNTAYAGGGVFVLESDSLFDRCVFESNNTLVRGAGVYCVENEARFVRCEFRDNSSTEGGSGMYIVGGQPEIVDCVFENNTAQQVGGAIANIVSRPTIARCLFKGNRARDGAAFHNDSGLWPMTDCVFIDNVATDNGGAISIVNGFIDVTNCVFTNNRARRGGAIVNLRGFPNFVNCSFVENFAQSGGDIFSGNIGMPTITNSILWGSRGAPAPIEGTGFIDVTYSCIEGGFAGTGNINTNPGFIDDEFRVGSGSPCVDAGSNDALAKRISSDLDGNPRFTDDPDTPDTGDGDAPLVDMGAYEFQPGLPALRLAPPAPGRVGMENLLQVTGATPGHEVVYVYGFEPGVIPVPLCPDLHVLIGRPLRLGLTIADENGIAQISGNVPPKAEGIPVLLQAAEPRTCRVSNLVEFKFTE